MANKDLLKEAIADARLVKETAIANAKAALEEAFAPHIAELLSEKVKEMDLKFFIEQNITLDTIEYPFKNLDDFNKTLNNEYFIMKKISKRVLLEEIEKINRLIRTDKRFILNAITLSTINTPTKAANTNSINLTSISLV